MTATGAQRRLRAWRATLRIAFDMARSWTTPPGHIAAAGGGLEPADWLQTRPLAGPPAAAGDDLRLVSWNIHREYDRVGIARGLTRLRAEVNPDLVLLQEVPAADGVAFWERAAVVAALAELSLAWAPMHRVLRRDAYYDFDASGQLTGSRRPLLGCEVVALPTVSMPKLGVAHRFQRLALLVRVAVGRTRVTVANLHLENTARPAGRAHQMAALVSRLEPGPAVIVGDLNTLFGRHEPLWEVAAAAGFEPLAIEPRRRLVPRLDHVLVRDVAGSDGRELAIAGSDHRPLMAVISAHSR